MANLLDLAILHFVFGIFAGLVKSNLERTEQHGSIVPAGGWCSCDRSGAGLPTVA